MSWKLEDESSYLSYGNFSWVLRSKLIWLITVITHLVITLKVRYFYVRTFYVRSFSWCPASFFLPSIVFQPWSAVFILIRSDIGATARVSLSSSSAFLSSSLVFCHIFRNKLWQKLETKKQCVENCSPKPFSALLVNSSSATNSYQHSRDHLCLMMSCHVMPE